MGIFDATFKRIDKVFVHIDETFEHVFDTLAVGDGERAQGTRRSRVGERYRVVQDDAEKIKIEVDMPGARDISVGATEHDLLVEWRRGESGTGKLKLTFADRVLPNHAGADYVDGVLHVWLVKGPRPCVERVTVPVTR